MSTKRRRPPATTRPRTRPPSDSGGRQNRLASVARKEGPKLATVAPPPTVVAVGASAGGLDAFSQILERIAPSPNVAFIFVQHLSPQHESALPALLSARTKLPVVQATDGMRIEANHVFVMPPNVHMEIVDGRLSLLPRPHDRTQFTPIDFFFESLARWAQEKAIGVILSGTASDGAIGIREIKAVGGITIAQQPESARYDGMPRAAIATGMIDLVLSPSEIAEHISHVRHHPYLVRRAGDAGDDLFPTEEQFRELFGLLRRASGIDFKQYKLPTVKRRLLRRMALHRLTDVDAYLRYLREHPAEATALCQDLLIHVTRFFRDPESFKALEAHVFSEMSLDRSDDAIRIWVPGCATGEEAYSVAIVLLELIGDRVAERKIQIFATDVNEATIEQARAGTYPSSISADVSPERLRRFFTKADGGYRVSKILRDMCVFARHDLARDPPFSRIDLIVCRNVLIYLDATLQKRLISVFHYALKSRGFLMLGSAETTGPQAAFTLVDKKWRLYKKAPVEAMVTFAMPSDRWTHIPTGFQAPGVAARLEGRPVPEEANRLILERYGPPGVVVDANLDIVHFRGHTGPYLESATGEPSHNILKMARGGLLHPLRSVLSAARRKRRPVRRESVLVQRNGGWRAVNIEVVPLVTARGEYMLVLFETPPAAEGHPKAGRAAKRQTAREDARISDLRRELAASRDYLQSIIQELEAANEELQSANEEILSSNEELQSTNEELDTAKEELQSTNEELNTLNEELHSRNEELARVNSDLLNLLGSVDLPIVIVGNDMAIRRFTPAAERVFNLIPADVGRPIGQINPNVNCNNLDGLIRQTIDELDTHQEDVQDRNGRWYTLGIRPYKGVDSRVDGAVVTAIDIEDSKRYRRQADRLHNYFTTIVETIDQPLLLLDSDLRVRGASKLFCEIFGVLPQQIDGSSIFELGKGRWNLPELKALLAAAVDGERAPEASLQLPTSSGPKSILVKARGFEADDPRHWILLAMDIQDAPKVR